MVDLIAIGLKKRGFHVPFPNETTRSPGSGVTTSTSSSPIST
jgi:hypothetical protein